MRLGLLLGLLWGQEGAGLGTPSFCLTGQKVPNVVGFGNFPNVVGFPSRKKPVLKIARTQLPLAPAYAITAHGSQGKTLPAALVDFNVDKRTDVTFGTVAASRVRSREDVLILRRAREGRGARGKGGKQKQVASPQAVRALALHAWRAGGPGAPAAATARRGGELGSLQGGEGALRGVREMQRGQDAGLLLRSAVGARPGQPLGHLPCLRPRQGRAEDAEAEAALRPGALGLPRV